MLAPASTLPLLLLSRQQGAPAAPQWRDWGLHRLRSLALSSGVHLAPAATGSLLALAVDPVEQRYALTGSGDTTLDVWDLQQACDASSGGGREAAASGHAPVWSCSHRSAPGAAHRYAVTSVCWYPVDTGLALSGSADATVKLWDTNVALPAATFEASAKVWCLAMSPLATSHCLVAVGTAKPQVTLLDPLAGAAAHTLTGHKGEVMAIAWSLTSQFQLYSGDASGRVICWDVRRSGPLRHLDQYATRSAAAAAARGSSSSRPHGLPQHRPAAAGSGRAVGCEQHRPASAAAAAASRAHDGGVTSIHATADGLHLVTAGRDSRARLWDARSGTHLLVHYPGTVNRSLRPLQLSSTDDGRHLFVPSNEQVQVYDTVTGSLITQLRSGHYEPITCCQWVAAGGGRLLTAGHDNALLVWEPMTSSGAPVTGEAPGHAVLGSDDAGADADNWSDEGADVDDMGWIISA